MKTDNKDSFVVDMWSAIFRILGKLSIFELVCWVKKKKLHSDVNYRFIDKWVIGNSLAAIILSIILFNIKGNCLWLMIIISTYGFFRVFEVIVYQINLTLFDSYRAHKKGEEYQVKSIRRIILLLLHNYVEIMFWYASIMLTVAYISDIRVTTSWIEYITSTILCVATFDRAGLESIISENLLLMQLAFMEIVSGLIMTIISLARFIGILPTVDEIDKWK